MGENAKIKLNSVIPHFRHDIYWPGWMYMEIESRRIFQNSQRLIRMDKTNREQNRPTGDQLLQKSMYGDWNIVNEKITDTLPSFVRTGDTFYRTIEADLSAFVKARLKPQLFMTVTLSERWPEFRTIIQSAQDFLNTLSGEAHGQAANPTNFPWEAVEYYYERIYHLRRHLLANPRVSGFGKLKETVIRYEFQLRQAIHSHMLLWTEHSIEELISRNYVRADIPDRNREPQLYDLVNVHQIHTCQLHLCGKPPGHSNVQDPCKKGFPQPLSPVTYHEPGELRYRYARFKVEDQNVVPYCAPLLLIWKAHVNVQYVTTAGLTKYVSKYVTKTEPKSVVSIEQGEGRVKSHLEARRLGAMEIMCLLNSKPILKMSSGVQFLPNSMPENRTWTVR